MYRRTQTKRLFLVLVLAVLAFSIVVAPALAQTGDEEAATAPAEQTTEDPGLVTGVWLAGMATVLVVGGMIYLRENFDIPMLQDDDES